MKRILLLLLVVVLCLCTIAQNGLDPSFGTNGYTRTFFPVDGNFTQNECKQVLADADGSFYLVIQITMQTMITRRFPNGSLDEAYGEKGYSVPVYFRGGNAVLLPDGKIVLSGSTGGNFGITRLTSSGKIDSTFSGDGTLTTDFGSTSNYIGAIALQNDGKIIAVGSFNNNQGFALARYNTDGSPDNSFSGDGRQVTEFGMSNTYATSVAIGANGRIIAAGTAGGRVAVAAYLPDGNLDNLFSSDGIATFANTSTPFSAAARAVTVQNDGKIVIDGSAAGIFRLNVDGIPDSGFSDDGNLMLDLQNYEKVEGIGVDQDGNILVCGSTIINGHQLALVERFTATGVPDPGFSDDGKATVHLVNNNYASAYGLAVQPDGRILIAGIHGAPSFGSNFFVVRLNHDGTLDTTLDGDGILSDYKQYGHTEYYASAVQADGKIIAAGYARTAPYLSEFAVARYNTNGLLDNSFSQDGMATVAFTLPGYLNQFMARAIAIQTDGKIIVVGILSSQDPDFAIVRFNPDGSFDNTFSNDGKLLTDFGGRDEAYAVAIQPDGKIVVAGSSASPPIWARAFALARYHPDGSLDNSFSFDGKLMTEDLGPAYAVLIQPDGKILAAGGEFDFAMVRYLSDGSNDPSFGAEGIVTTDFGGTYRAASAVSLLPGGSIVVAGTTSVNNESHMAVLKFNPDGTPDLSFSSDGKVILQFGSRSDYCRSLVLLPTGKIALGGSAKNELAVVQLNSDGTPDSNFLFLGGGPVRGRLEALSIHNNRIYAVGTSTAYGDVAGLIFAVSLECSFDATIPDAFALSNGVEPNTVYIGYAPASALRLKAESNSGTPPYNYLWSTGETSQSISVSPNIATNYSVRITDAAGCTKTVTTLVNVVDVRCGNTLGNVLVCKVPPGNPANAKTYCISSNAVAPHLSNGSYLGNCVVNQNTSARFEIIQEESEFSIKASPNPGKDIFTLDIRINNNSKAELIIRDVLGRIIEKRIVEGNNLIRIGSKYAPGIYSVELIQGKEKRITRLIKVSK
ncbi:MAG TPA: T9SS type A sorting domain-containing protein [Chitinophagaceae bacterium]